MRGSGLFVHFFRWYVPYFQAYTFVLARANEYEADCAAARVAGARNTADALLTVEVTGRFMEERFWSTFMAGADKSPAPAFLPYTQLPLSLNVGLDEGDGQAWLKAALLRKTGMDDTHPSLKDRLAALGEPPRLPPRRITRAAKVLLGEHMEAVVREFDQAWGKRNLREWGERYKEAQELKVRAAVISAKAKSGSTLSAEDWTAFGEACLRFGGKEKAIGHFHKALEISPDHAEAHMAIAEVLLERRDAAALGHLDSAIAKGDADMAWSASVLAARFMREAGRPRDAERYERKLTAQHAQAREKEVHRVVLMDDDTLAPQDLSAEDAKHCRAAFKRIPRLRSVRAFCKVMPGAGELHLVFVVEGKLDPVRIAMQVFWRLTGISENEDPLADQVVDALPLKRPFTVFNEDYLAPAVQGMVWRLEDSVIYKAP
jgi:tetratricopeptide (TPR) repeat protein